MSNKGQLFVVAAPSGAGKTSLVHALVQRDPRLVISVSYTTRPPRRGEVDGVHYHFVDVDTFLAHRDAGRFLEHAEVYGHWYGTHRDATSAILNADKDVILEIDWQGARQIRDAFPRCHSVFILPPSLESLRQRLGNRAQDSEAVIARRMTKAQAEISHCNEFEYVIVNDDFDQALLELEALIRHWRGETGLEQKPHDALLAELLEER